MDEKKIEEIVSEIVRGADPEKIPAYRRASYDDRERIDARVVEIRRRRPPWKPKSKTNCATDVNAIAKTLLNLSSSWTVQTAAISFFGNQPLFYRAFEDADDFKHRNAQTQDLIP